MLLVKGYLMLKLQKVRGFVFTKKILITYFNYNLMNNGLTSLLFYMYLLCSGGQRPLCPWNYSENTWNFIPFPYTHWQHACCLIRVIPCMLCKCREICIYQKVLITVSTNNNNLLLFMNNGLIPLLLYVYLLCSGGRQPWRRILLYGPPGTGDHLQSNLY